MFSEKVKLDFRNVLLVYRSFKASQKKNKKKHSFFRENFINYIKCGHRPELLPLVWKMSWKMRESTQFLKLQKIFPVR